MFIDETSVKTNMTPLRGRSLRGKRLVADAPFGKWNRFHITMVGDRLTVVLNGQRVLEEAHLPGVNEAGPIALQHHGSPLQFANIFVREIE